MEEQNLEVYEEEIPTEVVEEKEQEITEIVEEISDEIIEEITEEKEETMEDKIARLVAEQMQKKEVEMQKEFKVKENTLVLDNLLKDKGLDKFKKDFSITPEDSEETIKRKVEEKEKLILDYLNTNFTKSESIQQMLLDKTKEISIIPKTNAKGIDELEHYKAQGDIKNTIAIKLKQMLNK